LGFDLYMALAHHGHHRFKYSLDSFETQKIGSKELKLCLDGTQALQTPKNQSFC